MNETYDIQKKTYLETLLDIYNSKNNKTNSNLAYTWMKVAKKSLIKIIRILRNNSIR